MYLLEFLNKSTYKSLVYYNCLR